MITDTVQYIEVPVSAAIFSLLYLKTLLQFSLHFSLCSCFITVTWHSSTSILPKINRNFVAP